MEYKAIVSGHIWIDDDGDKGIEILTQIDNDDKGTEIFCDIDHALIDNIETDESDDYYFIAIVESKFTKYHTWEGTEYDTEHYVREIKTINDLNE
jgi:hypothetical protein